MYILSIINVCEKYLVNPFVMNLISSDFEIKFNLILM